MDWLQVLIKKRKIKFRWQIIFALTLAVFGLISFSLLPAGRIGTSIQPTPTTGNLPPTTDTIQVDASQTTGAWTLRDNIDTSTFSSSSSTASSELPGLARQLVHIRILGNSDLAPETAKNIWDFTKLDQVLNPLLQEGIQPLLDITSAPEWMSNNHIPGASPRNQRDFAAYCASIVAYYNSQGFYDGLGKWHQGRNLHLKYWEIWNEPDTTYPGQNTPFFTGQSFSQLYSATASAMLSVDPTLSIGGPGLSDDLGFLSLFLGQAKDVSFVTLHYFACPNDYSSTDAECFDNMRQDTTIATVRQIMESYGYNKVPLIIDQINADAGQAPVDQRNHDFFGAAFCSAALIYEGQMDGVDVMEHYTLSDDPLQGFGMVSSLQKYPTYWAYSLLHAYMSPGGDILQSNSGDAHIPLLAVRRIQNLQPAGSPVPLEGSSYTATIDVAIANTLPLNLNDHDGTGAHVDVRFHLTMPANAQITSTQLFMLDRRTFIDKGPSPLTLSNSTDQSFAFEGYGLAILHFTLQLPSMLPATAGTVTASPTPLYPIQTQVPDIPTMPTPTPTSSPSPTPTIVPTVTAIPGK